jgi:hypothetical protein
MTTGADDERSTNSGGCPARSRDWECESMDRLYLNVYVPHYASGRAEGP